MRILVAGGGSGGHVTPVLAILEALALEQPNLEVHFICDRKFAPQARAILAKSSLKITLKTVAAGKFRRYHGVPLWKQLLDIPTVALNIGDVFLLGIGTLQSLWQILRFRPAAVFTKGGFVCLPVGFAAHLTRKPLIIHDSDAHPGLTNRILAKWATFIATGAPLENYTYDKKRSSYVGIPINAEFQPVTPDAQAVAKQQIMHDVQRPLLAVVGGGLGSQRINVALLGIARQLLETGLEVIHVTGNVHGDAVADQVAATLPPELQPFYQVKPFIDQHEMATLLKAADVVVSRSGATTMAELAALGKAVILIPSPILTGGHQLKNADVFARAQAAEVVGEAMLIEKPQLFAEKIIEIATIDPQREILQKNILQFAKPHAATEVAKLIIQAAGQGRAKS